MADIRYSHKSAGEEVCPPACTGIAQSLEKCRETPPPLDWCIAQNTAKKTKVMNLNLFSKFGTNSVQFFFEMDYRHAWLLGCRYVLLNSLFHTIVSHNSLLHTLCFLNYNYFGSIKDNVYPGNLIPERSGDNDKVVVYLDIKLKVTNSDLHTTASHKVDNYILSFC